MSLLGKITGIFLLLIGVAVILFGVYYTASAFIGASAPSTGSLGDMMASTFAPAIGVVVLIWGIITAALGQGLYLLAQIAENTREGLRAH